MSTLSHRPESDPLSTRYSLLGRLQDWEDQTSWRDFFESYWRLIYSLAVKSGLTDAEAQDVVQETVICVAKDIHKFRRDRSLGSFRGWLRNIVRWRIADYLKKQSRGREERTAPGDAEFPDLETIPDPTSDALEELWAQEWQANLFTAAVERVKQKVKAEKYQMFDLYAVQELPVTEVARKLRVSVTKVYMAKHRIAALLKKEIQLLDKGRF
jgi:RNA polymerase sigma factor (sigma-70 family)